MCQPNGRLPLLGFSDIITNRYVCTVLCETSHMGGEENTPAQHLFSVFAVCDFTGCPRGQDLEIM